MSGLVPIAALLVITGQVDIDGMLVAETRGGEAPLVAGQPSQLTLAEVLTPSLALRIEDHRLDLRLDYGLRIFWSQSEGLPSTSPLFLNMANLSANVRLSRRTTLTGHVNASLGAADYTFLPQIVVTNQTATLQPVNFLSLAAGTGIQFRASRTWTVQSLVDAAHRRPTGDSAAPMADPANQLVFPRQTSVQTTTSATARVSRVDDVTVGTTVGYQATSGFPATFQGGQIPSVGDFSIVTVTPQIGWRARLTPERTLRVAAGFAYNHIMASAASRAQRESFSPLATSNLDIRLWRHQEDGLQLTIGAGVDYFVDPILGTAQPRGFTSSGLLLSLPPDWTIGLQASFATILSPRLTDPAAQYPDETTLAVSAPVRHRVSKNLILEFGGRYIHRAPRVRAPDFEFHQVQLWLYVMLVATSRPVPEFVP